MEKFKGEENVAPHGIQTCAHWGGANPTTTRYLFRYYYTYCFEFKCGSSFVYLYTLDQVKKFNPVANKFLSNLQLHCGQTLKVCRNMLIRKKWSNTFYRITEPVQQWTDLNKAVMKVESEHRSCITGVLADRALHLGSHNLLRIRARALVVIQAQLWLVLCPGHSAEACQQHCHQSQEGKLSLRLRAWEASHCDHF